MTSLDVSLCGITLHVKDVEQSKRFYEQIPGAVLIVHHPSQFALIQIGKGRIGLLKDDTETFHIEFETPELDQTHAYFLERGLTPKSLPIQRRWGRDFDMIDPSGNKVEFEATHIQNAKG